MKTYLIIAVCIILVICFLIVFYPALKRFIEKFFFKRLVYNKVYKIAKDNDFYLINKVALRIDNVTIHFDHLLFANKYIYCISGNYYPIAIDGQFEDTKWFNYKANNKHEFITNPMTLNRKRITYYADYVSSSKELFVSLNVVNDSCLLSQGINQVNKFDVILNLKHLSKVIKNYENDLSVGSINQDDLKKLVDLTFSKLVK